MSVVDGTEVKRGAEKKNPIQEKSYAFALRCIHLHSTLIDQKREFVLSKQLLRSGTSIGANVEEALQGQSKLDFVHKLSIALKEAHGTRYWLRLLRDACILPRHIFPEFLQDIDEIIKILTSIIRTSKSS